MWLPHLLLICFSRDRFTPATLVPSQVPLYLESCNRPLWSAIIRDFPLPIHHTHTATLHQLSIMNALARSCLFCGKRQWHTISRTSSSQTPKTIPEEDCHNKESLVSTVRPYIQEQTPVVLRGAVVRANAVEQWKSWEYLESAVDADTVCHVEVGGNYSQSERCDLRFGDYLAYLRLFEERHGRSRKQSAT